MTLQQAVKEFLINIGYDDWKGKNNGVVALVGESVDSRGTYHLGSKNFEKLQRALQDDMYRTLDDVNGKNESEIGTAPLQD